MLAFAARPGQTTPPVTKNAPVAGQTASCGCSVPARGQGPRFIASGSDRRLTTPSYRCPRANRQEASPGAFACLDRAGVQFTDASDGFLSLTRTRKLLNTWERPPEPFPLFSHTIRVPHFSPTLLLWAELGTFGRVRYGNGTLGVARTRDLRIRSLMLCA